MKPLAEQLSEHDEKHRVYTVDGAAVYLNIGRVKVYELINSGVLRTFKIGSRRLTTGAALQDAVAHFMKP